MYLLEGSTNRSIGSALGTGNTYITSVNLNTGKVVDRQLILTAPDLTYREPEGMSIQIPDIKHPQKAELCFGFASSFPPTRLASIYAFDRLLPEQALVNDRKNEKDGRECGRLSVMMFSVNSCIILIKLNMIDLMLYC